MTLRSHHGEMERSDDPIPQAAYDRVVDQALRVWELAAVVALGWVPVPDGNESRGGQLDLEIAAAVEWTAITGRQIAVPVKWEGLRIPLLQSHFH